MSAVIAISSGEPAGIGPDICLALAAQAFASPFVVLADPQLLRERAKMLRCDVEIEIARDMQQVPAHQKGVLHVVDQRLRAPVVAGQLDSTNAAYVLDMLREGAEGCLSGRYAALVTAPVHKSVIADAGFEFTGHTEFLAAICNVQQPVMLLTREPLRVALVTTHLPLRSVPEAITAERIRSVARVLHEDLIRLFGVTSPRILVLGLNPHAGEQGHLGREELEIIEPCLRRLRADGIDVVGPRPADTAFTEQSLAGFDAVLAMYHDQGLTPLKAGGFGRIVNITLGLPIVRTSVDHGTAPAMAGSGDASAESLVCALQTATALAARKSGTTQA